MERKLAVFADVLLGPMYGESYDMVVTESRLLLVHVSHFGMKWKPFEKMGRDLKVYDHEAMEVLANRDGSVSVPFKSIRRVAIRKARVQDPAWYYLLVKYEREDGKRRKMKIMLFSPPGDLSRREFAIEVQTALEKALPPEVSAQGTWLA